MDIKKFIKKVLMENIDSTELEIIKMEFDSLNADGQWRWLIQNKDKIAQVSIDEDMAHALLKNDVYDWQKGESPKASLHFKSGGGHNAAIALLNVLGIGTVSI